jgi:hypothetical protein
MVWKKAYKNHKTEIRAINLKWDFTLQITTEVREYLRVNMRFNTANELLACIELDISRSVVRGNQAATDLQYLCKSNQSFICDFAAHNLKSPL